MRFSKVKLIMSKIVLNDITNTGQVSVINSNFDKIEAVMNNQVLYRNNPTGEPNALITNVDANGRRIYNLPKAITLNEPLRWQDLLDINSGIPGSSLPLGASDITVLPQGGLSSTNVQAALEELSSEISGAGGSGGVGGTTLTNFVMNSSTPNRRVEFPNTFPNGWNLRKGSQTVDFEMVSTNYFSANPSGHIAVVLRCDTSIISTQVSGQGIAIGDLIDIGLPINDDGPPYKPASQIETWSPGSANARWVFPYTWSGESKKMLDGVRYRFIIDSTVAEDGNKFIRYRRYRYFNARQAWDLEVDTGDVLDHNTNADLTQSGLVFGEVFSSDRAPWTLSFENVKVTWKGHKGAATDARAFLSRFSPEVEGDIVFVNGSNRIRVSNSGLPATWTAFMSSTVNGKTQVVSAPNGSSRTASFVAVNNSDITNFGSVSIAAFETYAALGTDNQGSGSLPELRLEYGYTNWLAKLNSSGMWLRNGNWVSTLPLGRDQTTFSQLIGTGGYNARQFANGTGLYNIEDACSVGHIEGLLSALGGVNGNTVETVIRPLYCLVSTVIDLARKKGTI